MNFEEIKKQYDDASIIEKQASKSFTVQLRHLSDNMNRNLALSLFAENPSEDSARAYVDALEEYKAEAEKLEELRSARQEAQKALDAINKLYGPIMAIRHNMKLLAKEGFSHSHVIGIME